MKKLAACMLTVALVLTLTLDARADHRRGSRGRGRGSRAHCAPATSYAPSQGAGYPASLPMQSFTLGHEFRAMPTTQGGYGYQRSTVQSDPYGAGYTCPAPTVGYTGWNAYPAYSYPYGSY